MPKGGLLFLPLCLLITRIPTAASSWNGISKDSTSSATPIRHWEPSWVASSAQGTSVAVACNLRSHSVSELGNKDNIKNNAVLILTRSAARATVTSRLQWRPSARHGDWEELQIDSEKSLRILGTPMDAFVATSPSHSRSSWIPFGTTAICAMTGLASDIDHVSRVVQKQVDTHRYIYDHCYFPSPISQTVKVLAETVQEAAQYAGGRPYGLQALVVGQESSVSSSNQGPLLYVYSIDPSGAWRHWGSGCSAIGKNAEEVRRQLYKELSETQSRPLNPRMALRVAMKGIIQAMRASFISQDADEYEAVLFWVDFATGQCRVASLDPKDVQECREELWTKLQTAST